MIRDDRTAAVTPILRQAVLIGAPIGLGALAAIHPPTVADDTGSWIPIHILQVPLVAMLGLAVTLLLGGLTSVAATVARVALLPWIAGFAAFDGVAGLAVGIVSSAARGDPSLAASADGLVTQLMTGTPVELIGTLTILSALVAFLAGGFALWRAGRSPVGALLIAVSGPVWTAIHPLIGAGAMLAFLAGTLLLERPAVAISR
jgi:hypothetical protein